MLVVASASLFADMAEVISGGLLEVRSIVPVGGDPHLYEPTPSDLRLVAGADLVLVNGLTFEGWINNLVANSGTAAPVVTLTRGIEPIASEEYANASDPHAWMNAANGLVYAANIRDALVRLDPANADVYRFNAKLYRQQIQDLHDYIQEQINRVPAAQRVLITSHDAFRYYGRAYGLRVEAALGTSTDAEVRTADVQRLTQTIRRTGVPAIFVESTINPKLIRQIALDNEVAIGGYLYADSLGDSLSPAPTYLQMLRYNTDTVVGGLLGQTQDNTVLAGPDPLAQLLLLGFILTVMGGAFGFVVFRLNRGVATAVNQ